MVIRYNLIAKWLISNVHLFFKTFTENSFKNIMKNVYVKAIGGFLNKYNAVIAEQLSVEVDKHIILAH